MDAHSGVPLVLVGTGSGWLFLFDLTCCEEITRVGELFLSRFSIRVAKFIVSRQQIAVFDDIGDFYFIEVEQPANSFGDVKIHVDCCAKILSCSVWGNENSSGIIALVDQPTTKADNPGICELVYIDINANFDVQLKHFELSKNYSSVSFFHSMEKIIAVERLSSTFDVLEIQKPPNAKGDLFVQLLRTIQTDHSIGGFDFSLFDPMISCGADGTVAVWCTESFAMKFSDRTHSLLSGGVKDTIFNRKHKYELQPAAEVTQIQLIMRIS